MLRGVNELYVSKGKVVRHVDLRKERLDQETLNGLLLGPSGNLRAPTLRIGKTLIVGFDEATYRDLLT